MKVGFDGRSLHSPTPRGWDRYTLELLARLPKFGVEPYLFYRRNEPIARAHAEFIGCTLVPLDSTSPGRWEQVALPLALARMKLDLYHAPAEHGVPLGAPCPSLLTLHSLTHQSYLGLLEAGVLRGELQDYLGPTPPSRSFAAFYAEAQFFAADHLIVPSEFCRDEVLRFLRLSPRRVTVTHLAPPSAFLEPPSSSQTIDRILAERGIARPYVLYVGGYEPHKNVRGFLAVAKELARKRPGLSFVLVGSRAAPDELLHVGSSLPKVHFLSEVRQDLVALYDAASVLLTMSWRESFCLPVVEALSRGVPVVASRLGAAAEVLGDVGELIDPNSVEAAAAAVLRVLSQPVDPSVLRARANMFSWDRTAALTASLYATLRSRRDSARALMDASRRAGGVARALRRALRRAP